KLEAQTEQRKAYHWQTRYEQIAYQIGKIYQQVKCLDQPNQVLNLECVQAEIHKLALKNHRLNQIVSFPVLIVIFLLVFESVFTLSCHFYNVQYETWTYIAFIFVNLVSLSWLDKKTLFHLKRIGDYLQR